MLGSLVKTPEDGYAFIYACYIKGEKSILLYRTYYIKHSLLEIYGLNGLHMTFHIDFIGEVCNFGTTSGTKWNCKNNSNSYRDTTFQVKLFLAGNIFFHKKYLFLIINRVKAVMP